MSEGRILVIDDQRQIRDYVREVLEEKGYEVIEAADPDAGLESFRAEMAGLSLVILDLDFGDGEQQGIATLKRMREVSEDVPVIILSGKATVPLAVEALKAGATDVLEKDLYFDKALDASVEQIRRFQVHLAVEKKRSFTVLNQTVCALRFLYRTTLGTSFPIELIPYARREKKLPVVLSRIEVEVLLRAPSHCKHRAILATFYWTGIPLSELRSLGTADVDAARGTIRVHGKGAREREVPRSPRLLILLRAYWRAAGVDSSWLFPGKNPASPLCRETIQKIVSQAARLARLSKRVSPHVLRHTFATHLLESGVDLLRIQCILGHASLKTSTVYLHLASNYLESVQNPFDLLPDKPAAAQGGDA